MPKKTLTTYVFESIIEYSMYHQLSKNVYLLSGAIHHFENLYQRIVNALRMRFLRNPIKYTLTYSVMTMA